MTETTKNYIRGNAKAVNTQYGTLINLFLSKEDLDKLPTTDKGFIKLTVAERKEIGKYGDTHSVFENTFVPTKQNASEAEAEEKEEDLF